MVTLKLKGEEETREVTTERAIFGPLNTYKLPNETHGGIPICFPQFGNQGSLHQNGFVRRRFWKLDTDTPLFPATCSKKAFVDLIFKSSQDDLRFWPHSFEFRLRVTLAPGGALNLTSRIRNVKADGKPFSFTFAYHNYFPVINISDVQIEGLETSDYLDNLKNKERFTEQGNALTFESEVDKIYLSTPAKIAILDHSKRQIYAIRKDGLLDAVVWNPGDKKSKAMADFGKDEYNLMVCVESAAVENPIKLKPGEEWRGCQELYVIPSS
ncbi:putative glucose-6-phosphate 1-epimerase [Diospyros lotus]|uniref:putative glucose-6-phosphate 1-epimerase n=1 Tax=Diospyros lotus TaxID=55363 RepID=UPI00224E7243|nr:putative glucose-6-phosphate 1-epimerase [Diospyros lotus]